MLKLVKEITVEFNEVSALSEAGQFTLKQGALGLPFAVLPIPNGGDRYKERQKQRADFLAASPLMYQALKFFALLNEEHYKDIAGGILAARAALNAAEGKQ